MRLVLSGLCLEPFCYSDSRDRSDGRGVETEGDLQNLVSFTWELTKYGSGKHSHNEVPDQ